MTIYNVAHSVVDLIEADTPEAAVAELSRRLSAAGFEPYPEYPEDLRQAFVSEDQSPAAQQLVRGDATTPRRPPEPGRVFDLKQAHAAAFAEARRRGDTP